MSKFFVFIIGFGIGGIVFSFSTGMAICKGRIQRVYCGKGVYKQVGSLKELEWKTK